MFFRHLNDEIKLSLTIPPYAEELFAQAEKLYDKYVDYVVYGLLKEES